MTKRNNRLLVLDMLEACARIHEFTLDHTQESFEASMLVRRAVEREFEIIGEAARQTTAAFRTDHPEIDWRILNDFRNRLIHGYMDVDPVLVWEIVQEYLEPLQVQLKDLLASISGKDEPTYE